MRYIGWFSLTLFWGCALLPPSPSDWKRCRFELTSLHFDGFRENQTEWQIILMAHNPNSRRLKLEGVQLSASQDGAVVAQIENDKPLDLAPRDSTSITLNVKLPHSAWITALPGLGGGKVASVTVAGDALYHTWFGTKRIKDVFKKTYQVDLRAVMDAVGGNLFQGLLRGM